MNLSITATSTVIAVANQKGGVGKTTLAANLARRCYTTGGRALVIDADPQHSLRYFAEDRGGHLSPLQVLPIVEKNYPTLHDDIAELKKGWDFVFIDCGGRLSEMFRSALKAADTILVPMKPGPQETRSTYATLDLIEELNLTSPKRVLVVYNLVRNNTRFSKQMDAFQESVMSRYSDLEIHFLATRVAQREAWLSSFAGGLCLEEIPTRSRDPKAINELEGLHQEIQRFSLPTPALAS